MFETVARVRVPIKACQASAACSCTLQVMPFASGRLMRPLIHSVRRTKSISNAVCGLYRSVVVCQAVPAADQHAADHHHQPGVADSSHTPPCSNELIYSGSGRHSWACRSSCSRRKLVLQSSLAPLLVQLLIGSGDATTVVNSVLSAYGLPTFKATAGFKLYDEFEDDFSFEYPKSWVSRPNTLRKGVYISDFQTADKVSVEELDLPADGDIATAAVAAAVYPGGNKLVEDATITLPARRSIKSTMQVVDGQEIMYLEFPSETVTRSGYNIRRKNFAAAAVKRNKLYTIAASARSDQYNEDKKQLLQHIIQSFRLR